MNTNHPPLIDVCVVGAGLAGLSTADKLLSAGLSVEVLEAQSSVGGRIKDEKWAGHQTIELGANWFSKRQRLISEQIKRFKLETVTTHDVGKHLFAWNGKSKEFSGAIPPLGAVSLFEMYRALRKFDRMAAQLTDQEPWSSESMKEFDHRSFGQWIDATLFTKDGREFFHLVSEMVFGVESYLVSLLYVLYYAARSGSLESLISVTNGHQELRFKNGPTDLCDALAKHIGPRILLNTPVDAVRVLKSGVEVRVQGATSRRYKMLVCAVSPAAARRIEFSPNLSTPRDRLLQSLPMGRVIKIQALFDRPFWIELGLSGQVMSNGNDITYLIDNSPSDRRVGMLAGFVCSSRADRFLRGADDARSRVADSIVQLFAERIPGPNEILIEDWAANPWIGGSYGAYCPPGVMTRFGRAMREVEPPIFWCGAEYGAVHPCQMEGAIESGQRSARAVVQALAA